MNRRELLKPLAAMVATPLLVKGKDVGRQIRIDEKKYIVFVDRDMVDIDAFCQSVAELDILPGGTPVIPVFATRHRTIDDAIRIYEIKETGR